VDDTHEPQRVVRLLDAVAARSLDAVTFTSAPAAEALLVAAEQRGRRAWVVNALRTDVLPFAVGPITAAPLRAAGIDSIHPDRYRLGALVRVVCEHLTEHQGGGSRPHRDCWKSGVTEPRLTVTGSCCHRHR
jgi:uroporphyrinogen-III synthase